MRPCAVCEVCDHVPYETMPPPECPVQSDAVGLDHTVVRLDRASIPYHLVCDWTSTHASFPTASSRQERHMWGQVFTSLSLSLSHSLSPSPSFPLFLSLTLSLSHSLCHFPPPPLSRGMLGDPYKALRQQRREASVWGLGFRVWGIGSRV